MSTTRLQTLRVELNRLLAVAEPIDAGRPRQAPSVLIDHALQYQRQLFEGLTEDLTEGNVPNPAEYLGLLQEANETIVTAIILAVRERQEG